MIIFATMSQAFYRKVLLAYMLDPTPKLHGLWSWQMGPLDSSESETPGNARNQFPSLRTSLKIGAFSCDGTKISRLALCTNKFRTVFYSLTCSYHFKFEALAHLSGCQKGHGDLSAISLHATSPMSLCLPVKHPRIQDPHFSPPPQ